MILPLNAENAIILPGNQYMIIEDSNKTLSLWDCQKGIMSCSTGKAAYYGTLNSVFPYPHVPFSLGFISTHINPNDYQYRSVCCWVINQSETGDNAFVPVAYGVVNTSNTTILRVTHRGSTMTADLTIILECSSGQQFSAFWYSGVVALGNTPEQLQFVEEAEQSPLKHTSLPLVFSEAHPRWSEDNIWILDERGRQILWVPPAYRRNGRWHGRQLLLHSASGRIVFLDFANAIFDEDVPF
jgi:hypothetical protein